MRAWRKEAVRAPGGTSWRLAVGRSDSGRVRLNLGRVAEDVAQQALEAMQAEENAGRAARLIEQHERLKSIPGGLEEFLAILLDADETRRAFLPEAKPDYARMPLRRYFDDVFGKARKASRPKSWRTEEGNWKRINADLGDLLLGKIEARDFVRWVRDLQVVPTGGVRKGTAREGTDTTPRPPQPASGQYKAHLRTALQACLSHAYLEGHVDTHVRLGELRLEGSTSRTRVKPAPLTRDELVKLLDASEPKHRAMWGTGVGLGLRPSELRRLDWEDIVIAEAPEDSTVHLRGDDQGRGKTALSVDTIPMTKIAFDELRTWWMANGQPRAGIVFPSGQLDEEGRPLPYESIAGYKRSLASCAKRAGIERDVNPYLLRDSFATIAWQAGVEKDVTRRIGRWTDEKMLDEVYARPTPAQLGRKLTGKM